MVYGMRCVHPHFPPQIGIDSESKVGVCEGYPLPASTMLIWIPFVALTARMRFPAMLLQNRMLCMADEEHPRNALDPGPRESLHDIRQRGKDPLLDQKFKNGSHSK